MTKRLLTGAVLGLSLLAGFASAGCAGGGHRSPGVATADGVTTAAKASASTSANGNADPAEKGRQFAACMRENGVDMPDPGDDGDGHFQIKIGEGDGPPPDRATVEAAQAKCKQYLPNGGVPPKLDAEQLENARKMSQCMRDNGITNFPDPDPNGMIRIEGGPGSPGGMDPQDPAFQAAQE
jgi:hypothetical protein